MSKFYKDYTEAFNAAVKLARTGNREVGLEKFKEYNTPGFLVYNLPKPAFRTGHELRCQVVGPSEPLMSR